MILEVEGRVNVRSMFMAQLKYLFRPEHKRRRIQGKKLVGSYRTVSIPILLAVALSSLSAEQNTVP